MLIQFTVENYLSFKDKTVFSLLATGDDSHPEHLISNGSGKNKNVLRAAAIYGPNASGKSNLIKAMKFARDLILKGTEPDKAIAVKPFKLGTNLQQPSGFQFIFTYKDIEYSYGFKLNRSVIIEEFLYGSPNGKEVKFFERFTSDELKTEATFGPGLKNGSKERSRYLDYKKADTRPNQLLLTAIFEGNLKDKVSELEPVVRWFDSVLTIIGAESKYRYLDIRVHDTESLKQFLATLLRASDTGVQEVVTTETPLDWDRDLHWILPEMRDRIVQKFSNLTQEENAIPRHEQVLGIHGPQSSTVFIRQNEQGELLLLRLLLRHAGEDGKLVDFRMNEQSDGTQRVIHLGPMLFDLSEGRENVIVLDELDRRLHPHLSRLIVQTALKCQNKNQLLFTTHDTNLLDLDLLRRDEIWFVEKDKSGRSALYSLAEFKVRPDLQIEKGYLNGRFGAIPFIGDIGSLGWNEDPKTEEKESIHA